MSEATQKGLADAGYKIPTEIQKESLGNVMIDVFFNSFYFLYTYTVIFRTLHIKITSIELMAQKI